MLVHSYKPTVEGVYTSHFLLALDTFLRSQNKKTKEWNPDLPVSVQHLAGKVSLNTMWRIIIPGTLNLQGLVSVWWDISLISINGSFEEKTYADITDHTIQAHNTLEPVFGL